MLQSCGEVIQLGVVESDFIGHAEQRTEGTTRDGTGQCTAGPEQQANQPASQRAEASACADIAVVLG